MIRFLEQTAAYLFEHHKDELEKLCVVLPSRRAGLFLKKYLSQLTNTPVFSPEIYSIEDFVFKLSGLRKIEPAYLLFELYEVYLKLEGEKAASFTDFVKWAEVVVKDFNEVDLYLVDPGKLFGFLSDAKAISLWNLNEEPLTPFESRYLHFFSSLSEFYTNLSARLLAKKIAYQGLAYRTVSENLVNGGVELPWKRIVFAGFNALTAAEEKIFKSLIDQKIASVLWDADPYYLDNPIQEAGFFLRRNMECLELDSLTWTREHFKQSGKSVRLIGVPKNVGQAKVAGEILASLQQSNPTMDNTSIVLNDETLLFPMLNSLPETVSSFNLTMGLPLKKTILYGLVDDLIQMNINALRMDKSSGKALKFYFKDLQRIIDHPAFIRLAGLEKMPGEPLANRIRSKNLIFYSREDVPDLFSDLDWNSRQMLSVIFTPWGNEALKAIEGIQFLLSKLKFLFAGSDKAPDKIDTEYVFHFTLLFNKLKSSFQEFPFLKDLESFRHVYLQIIRSVTIPFYGEPLHGVQVMGMLETRTLDFDNIIMLSVNEDFIPGRGTTNSFIPFEIKRKFHLPTHRERNAVSAYHFYRLLQRAKNVFLLFNTESGELGGGDRSRFITQIEYELTEYNPEIRMESEVFSVFTGNEDVDDAITIRKPPEFPDIISKQAQRGFSASALNTYRNCSLQFYFKYIVGIDETQEIEETIEASTLGSVVHDVLFYLYGPLKGKTIKAGDHKRLRTEVDAALKTAFQKNYPGGDVTTGKNLLISKVAETFVQKFLLTEETLLAEGAKFGNEMIIEDLEREMESTFSVKGSGGPEVKLRGVIDRIDRFKQVIRIIDYKTGSVASADLSLKSWEDLYAPGRFEKLFQLLFYAYLYLKGNSSPGSGVEAGIYSFRNLSSGFLMADLPSSAPINESMNDFEEVLRKLLLELYDMDIPFVQTGAVKVCEYCSFRSVCHR